MYENEVAEAFMSIYEKFSHLGLSQLFKTDLVISDSSFLVSQLPLFWKEVH